MPVWPLLAGPAFLLAGRRMAKLTTTTTTTTAAAAGGTYYTYMCLCPLVIHLVHVQDRYSTSSTSSQRLQQGQDRFRLRFFLEFSAHLTFFFLSFFSFQSFLPFVPSFQLATAVLPTAAAALLLIEVRTEESLLGAARGAGMRCASSLSSDCFQGRSRSGEGNDWAARAMPGR
ncbi:hypothetical protein BZA05DRAFT_184388 [Tricharina praecox]|uniref:uncharacterized protein n=1 Tax=Tricharina praecox TaxID=43433 RepID=UPI0022202B26|nr:uncharacterized protein BZA05DRAFT_184388 [Tricharina praecox]KAI5843243.1 hypothetical protein BZA05DRAFT_184388 [Tricharina praecox]